MNAQSLILVRFLRETTVTDGPRGGRYAPGEIAGFSATVAKHLVTAEVPVDAALSYTRAQYVDAEGQPSEDPVEVIVKRRSLAEQFAQPTVFDAMLERLENIERALTTIAEGLSKR